MKNVPFLGLGAFCLLSFGPLADAVCAAAAPAPTLQVELPSPPPSIANRYRLDLVGRIALSPDGRHLAHTVQTGDTISLVITDLEQPTKKSTRLIGKNFASSLTLEETRGATIQTGVTFLQWISSDRLVYAVTQSNVRAIAIDEIWTVDSEGKSYRKLVDSEQLGDYPPEPFSNNTAETPPKKTKPELVPRSFRVLGPRLSDPETIAFEVVPHPRLEPPTKAPILGTRSGLYRLNVRTGKYTGLSSEGSLGRYLYDQQGHARLREPPGSWVRSGIDTNSNGVSGDLGGIGAPPATIFEPQKFQVRPLPDSRGWRDLNDLIARDLPRPLVFNTSIETHYSPRSFPIGFDHDPNVLYYASNLGRDTFGLYALDLRTGRPTDFAVEDPVYDLVDPTEALNESILVFDRQRKVVGVRLPGQRLRIRWVDAGLARVQSEIADKFPQRDVTLVDWDDARNRFIVHVGSLDDPGRDFLYDTGPQPRLRQLFRHAPLYTPEHLNRTEEFAFDTSGGVHLTGYLTLPKRPRAAAPPLVVICGDIAGPRDQPGIDPDAQALADFGFAVARVRYRGISGLGAQHRDAVREDLNRIPVEDIRETVRWLATRHATDPKRVVLFGHNLGGYFALRTAQLYPDEFRCIVTVNAPFDPVRYLRGTYESQQFPAYEQKVRNTFFDAATLAKVEVIPVATSLTRSVIMVQDEYKTDLASHVGRTLVDQLQRHGVTAEYISASPDFSNGEPEARAKVFGRIATFLNQILYDFKVDVGDVKEVK